MPKFLLFLFFILPFAAHADAIDKLKNFISSTHSGQANFTQDVLEKGGKTIQAASGNMQFVRPGKFRWAYQKPYEQLIVGDGEKFWLYDTDLNQVTVKKLDAALGSSPAALLSGNNEIERGFVLKDMGSREGLDWLQATPRTSETSFRKSSWRSISSPIWRSWNCTMPLATKPYCVSPTCSATRSCRPNCSSSFLPKARMCWVNKAPTLGIEGNPA